MLDKIVLIHEPQKHQKRGPFTLKVQAVAQGVSEDAWIHKHPFSTVSDALDAKMHIDPTVDVNDERHSVRVFDKSTG